MKYFVLLFNLMIGVGPILHAQSETRMTHQARGTFDVKTLPQPADDGAAGPFGRLFIDKKFHGALEGISKGQMLGSLSTVAGSGGYVALELVSGTLDGREGTFVLQHSGTMVASVPNLSVIVVPDSGTGQLTGITGKMTIIIVGKAHSYVFEYTLAR